MPLFSRKLQTENRWLAVALAVWLAALATLATTRLDFGGAPEAGKFRVAQLEEVNRVSLTSRTDTIDLTFSGAQWQLAGRYAADSRMIKVFFATLAQVQPVRPVTGAEADSAKKWVNQSGVTVMLFKNERLAQSFRAGGNPSKTIAYFFADDSEVYAMHIPGYRVYASAIFEQDELAWRDKRLFNFNWQNFRSLYLRSTDGAEHFQVAFNGKTYAIEALDTDTAKLHSYLDEVSLMAADAFYKPGTVPAFDSLLATAPAFEIKVNDVAGREYRLEVFRPVATETDLVARFNGEPIILSRQKGAALARRRSYFRPSPSPK